MYLNCHTYYSLRFGTFSEHDLLTLAQENRVKQLVLTDVNNTSACLNFVREAPKYDIKPILGIDLRNGVDPCFVGIAKNNKGYQELNEFLSHHLHNNIEIPWQAPMFKNTFVVYPFEKVLLNEKNEFLDNEYIGISIKDLRRLPFSQLKDFRDKLVVQQPVTFRSKRDFNAHRLLRAIDNNVLLSKLDEAEVASEEEKMYSIKSLYQAFSEYPHILENTEKLLDQCSIRFDFSKRRKAQNLKHYTGNKEEDEALLKKLCIQGLPKRYGKEISWTIKRRFLKEMDLIKKKGFVSYFLINWDIISYAKSQGFYYVGRGSGANSIIAYLLYITDVDPIDLDLYFERFINLYRANPPDFDIDFSWRDREAMTQYIFDRFNHVALVGTYVTFKKKGVIRELGKVFGLPKDEIDVLSTGTLLSSKVDSMAKLVLKYGQLIEGMPNYVSVHASGILISEKSLQCFSATFMPPKGFATVHFDMVIAEDVGLFKFDILAQRGLGKIKDTIAIVKQNQPEKADFDIHDVSKFYKNPVINNLIKTAQCMGCFYVESPAMRMLLKKLEVDNYLGLVAASSIIRPGVAKSGMMREYILRHRNPGRAEERAHPVMLDIMPETYGVMVYQEDVIKVAHYFADLTLGEADVLRRGMSGKFRSREEFEKAKDKFRSNCLEKGVPEKTVDEVWDQVASFAGYAFAKGHSASYAVESYQSLFLRAYFPLEYMVAVLNNGGGFYRPEFYVHDARMLGAIIHPPCVNQSHGLNVIYGKHVYLGMMYLRDLEERVMQRILKEREANDKFTSLENFIDRVLISIEQVSILIRINAFRFTGINKHELLWKAHLILGKTKRIDHPKLFPPKRNKFKIPKLDTTHLETAFEEWELLGFPLCNPFEFLQEVPKSKNGQQDLERYLNRRIDIYGYLITIKNTSTYKGDRMYFATLLDLYGEVFDTVLFPPVAAKYSFKGKGIYRFYGKVVSEFGFLSIEVIKMQKQKYVPDPRYADMKTSKKLMKLKEGGTKNQIGLN
ncbi:DNA polymerase III subunit alpha [Croceitalea rosinachiae]|uniref:DNA-directed DNA polymerase n=1 Tax=Croceitalea rosinachiae TaxID=3075596 RepID=A0ABU3A6P1_9FLAO|nr:DNA polymerase III subunit alpha [Croceitalea sp. F388]MDT0605845.1 DNA polymerase III subunit alpha [Croceitalea sp. F388]